MKNILELMNWRFACKHFDETKKISDSDLKDIMEVARLTPTSFGLQAWKFIVVTNQELKAKLAPACYNQTQITEASALVFCCAKTNLLGEKGELYDYIELYKKETNKTDVDVAGFKGMLEGMLNGKKSEDNTVWVQKQVYLAASAIILAAAEKEIDSCPMEGFNPAEVAKVLELPADVLPTVLVSMGYRKMEAPKKIRFPYENVVEIR